MISLHPEAALAAAVGAHFPRRAPRSIEEIATDLVGLHNTTQAGPYLAVRARFPEFRRADLEALMFRSWRMARFRGMRLTMFVFPNDLLEVAAAATRHLTEALGTRWQRESGLRDEQLDRIAASVDAALADGPLTVRALRRLLGLPTTVDLSGVVRRMCDTGRIVGGAPPRSWRSGIREYHRWNDVLPEVDLRRWDEADAAGELIRRYVRSYGPVTVDDVSWWTGITKRRCRDALSSLDSAVETVRVDGWPGPLFRLVEEAAGAGIADDDPGSVVRALPLLDPYVQGYRDRVRFLEPRRREYVYDGGGNATATLVSRGRIIGVWQTSDEPKKSIRYHLFDGGPAAIRRAAEDDLAAAGSCYFDGPVDVIEVAEMKPLSADGGRSASHPLDSRRHRASRRGRAERERSGS